MAETKRLRGLKILAKRYARANRIAQHIALDLIAGQLNFPNWVKLVAAAKGGWEARAEQLQRVEAFVQGPVPAATMLKGDPETMSRRFAYLDEAERGTIGEHAYRLQELLHDVIIAGDGWSIRVSENPSAVPIIESYVGAGADCPILDPDFLTEALNLARDRAHQVRSKISMDWPRRSTKPDHHGVVRHPFGNNRSDTWFCLHCDGKISGFQIAHNLWHCPQCGASPLDIFDAAFWADDAGRSFRSVEVADTGSRDTPEIVDGRPKLDLTEEKIVLLIRSALFDDARNVSEKMGALLAEITVDDDNGIWITLDVDLWPGDKDPAEASVVAKLLGRELEVDASMFTTPFAWPDLGRFASSTSDYTRMVLDAYAQHGSPLERTPISS